MKTPFCPLSNKSAPFSIRRFKAVKAKLRALYILHAVPKINFYGSPRPNEHKATGQFTFYRETKVFLASSADIFTNLCLFICRWGFTPYEDAKRFEHTALADLLQKFMAQHPDKDYHEMNKQMKNLNSD